MQRHKCRFARARASATLTEHDVSQGRAARDANDAVVVSDAADMGHWAWQGEKGLNRGHFSSGTGPATGEQWLCGVNGGEYPRVKNAYIWKLMAAPAAQSTLGLRYVTGKSDGFPYVQVLVCVSRTCFITPANCPFRPADRLREKRVTPHLHKMLTSPGAMRVTTATRSP